MSLRYGQVVMTRKLLQNYSVLSMESHYISLKKTLACKMTATSLLPQEAKVLGIEYGVLCEQVIAQALATYNGETEELPAPGTNSHYGKDDLKSL